MIIYSYNTSYFTQYCNTWYFTVSLLSWELTSQPVKYSSGTIIMESTGLTMFHSILKKLSWDKDGMSLGVEEIHSANSPLDTSPWGPGQRYYKYRQEACHSFSFRLVGDHSSVSNPSVHRAEEHSGFLLWVISNKYLLSFITGSCGPHLIMQHFGTQCSHGLSLALICPPLYSSL